jgi:hypothetical protein
MGVRTQEEIVTGVGLAFAPETTMPSPLVAHIPRRSSTLRYIETTQRKEAGAVRPFGLLFGLWLGARQRCGSIGGINRVMKKATMSQLSGAASYLMRR